VTLNLDLKCVGAAHVSLNFLQLSVSKKFFFNTMAKLEKTDIDGDSINQTSV